MAKQCLAYNANGFQITARTRISCQIVAKYGSLLIRLFHCSGGVDDARSDEIVVLVHHDPLPLDAAPEAAASDPHCARIRAAVPKPQSARK
jgi:hypothetical protein